MSESAPMIGPPDGSFAEAAWPEQPSGILESTEPLAATRQVIRGQARMASEYGAIAGPMGEPQPPMEPDEKIGADVLNKQYGIPGKLTFADPLPDSVARSMYETKIDEIKQQDITRRAPAGFVSGAARFGAQFAVGFLDPLQIGAAMVPIAPELEFGASLGARIGARAAEGAIGGLAGTAPLVGLQYGLSRQEQSDFTAYDALFGLAQGAGFGAGIGALSAGGGAFGRALSERYGRSRATQVAEADPSVRTGALQTILSQTEQEHPGEVRPIYDQANAPNVPEEAGYGAVEPMGTPRATAFLPENEPLGLTSFLQKDFTVGREGDVNAERRAGGLRDPGGDLDAIIGGPRGRPGLINNDSGSSFHDAAIRAYEAGYFDHVPEDNELLAAIEKDHNRTNPHDAVYSAHDQDAADAYRYARTRNIEIDQLSAQTGIPTEGLTHAQFWDQVTDHLSLEESQAHVDRLEQEHADAFEQAEQAAKEWMAEGGERPTSPEELYRGAPHTLEEMEHEWHQAESANPVSSGEGGGGQPGPAAEHPGDVQGGAGQVPGAAGAAGRAGPEERSQILQSALRDASGQRPPDPTGLAAERALKEGDEKNLVKLAQQDIEDHTAFFKAMSDANLQKEVRAIPTTPTGVPLKPTDGWKLHLNVEPGSRLAAEAEAEAMRLGAVQTKQGHNSGQEGKGVTIYIGSRDRATRIARGLAEKFELPEPTGEALVDDIPFAKGVVGRFDVGSTDRDFHQYGRDGDPILLDRVSYEKPYFSDEAMAVSRKELIRRYGEFYTGSKGGEVATGPYAGLTAEVRAEIERIHQEVDTDAANRIAAAKQAAACIARGIGGRVT